MKITFMSDVEEDGTVILFPYKGSKWGNPFVVSKEIPLEKSLQLYEKQLKELEGKNLGCFCQENDPCHAKILVKLFDAEK